MVNKITFKLSCGLWASEHAATPLLEPNSPPPLREAAERHDKSVPQIILRWQVQRGVAVIPKSANAKRIEENAAIFDFELSGEEVAAIESLNRPEDGRVILPILDEDDAQHPHFPFNVVF